jgi:cytochrome c oxidase subunit 2
MGPGNVVQSALSPAGPQAASIHALWSLMFWTSTTVFVIVIAFTCVAVIRATRDRRDSLAPSSSEKSLTRSVAAAVGATVVILVLLLIASVSATRIVDASGASSAVSVAVTGHQWWWEIEYEDAVPARRVLTANELHIPVARPVVLKVTSRDVIHSFWVPNLQGKRDLIPGYTTAIWLQADRPGVFRGQCAEFCGMQHAHMALHVIAEPVDDFERWLERMRHSAPEPQTDVERRGHDVFMTARCAGCHAVRGTDAHGQIAPDLTHIATRSSLGAGTLSNTREDLARWITDPQQHKPGNQMPPNPLSQADLDALVAYLSALR